MPTQLFYLGYMVDRKHRDFTDEDIQMLADTFKAFQDGTLEEVKGFCAVADIQTIATQDYILTPGRYVGIEEQEDDGEPFDEKMKRLTSELSDMFKKSHELENELREKLGRLGMIFETVRLGDVVLFNPRETIKKGEIAKKIDRRFFNHLQEMFPLTNY